MDDGIAGALPAEPMMDGGQMGGNVVPFPMETPPHIAELQRRVTMLARMANMPNAAEAVEETELHRIGEQVVREYDLDRKSREKWETRAKRAMELARQEKAGKSTPWENASNVKYPLLTTAALQFGARAYPAIVDGPRVVKCQVMGADPQGMKAGAADRVSEHMSYQLLSETEWESDVDTMVHQLPIIGCAFKKVYRDPSEQSGFRDELVSAFDLVVNQSAKSIRTVPRITHVFPLYPHEIAERQRAGTMLDIDLKGEGESAEDDDSEHMMLEQHRYIDIDGDGVVEPWVVTVHQKSRKVLRIVPCFDAEDLAKPENLDMGRGKIIRIPRRNYFVKVPFIPDPEGGFYDLGFGHLLGDINDEIDTNINQMNDAATMQNAGGGFIGGGIDLGKDKAQIRIAPGEYRTVRATGPELKNNIVPFDHPGPSKTTLDLLTLMIQAGKDISGVQDIMVGDSNRSETATTTMAKIEQGLKVFTAIYKRIFRALKEEFRIIYDINRAGLNPEKYAALMDADPQMIMADYQGQLDIMPVADPNNITDMQRMAKAQLALEQVVNGNPHVNAFEATRRAFEAARIERVEELLVPPPPPDQPPPPTPEQVEAETKQRDRDAEFAHKQRLAELDAEVKAVDAERKIMETQAKLETLVAQQALKVRELMIDDEELKIKAKAAHIQSVEQEINAEASAQKHEARMADLEEKGTAGTAAIRDMLDMLREGQAELKQLSQTIRMPKSVRFHRGADGRAAQIETDNGILNVRRGPDGMPTVLEPMMPGNEGMPA